MSVSYRSVSKSMLGLDKYNDPIHPKHFKDFMSCCNEVFIKKEGWCFNSYGNFYHFADPVFYVSRENLFDYFQDPLHPTPEELTIFEIEFKVNYPIEARTLFKKRKRNDSIQKHLE